MLCGLAVSHSCIGATTNAFAQEISAGERFLADLFDPTLDLLPEYSGAKVYWLFHDNYLAAKLLQSTRPDLSARIKTGIRRFGVSRSGKIEILFNEVPNALPFRGYQLLTVTNIAGKIIRTERVTTNILKGWEQYADLLLLSAIAKAKAAPSEAEHDFRQALALWEGRGFADAVFKKHHLHATYKLALAIIAAEALKQKLPFESEAFAQLQKLQSKQGGWITDYDAEGHPHGVANVETTCLVLLAFRTRSGSPD